MTGRNSIANQGFSSQEIGSLRHIFQSRTLLQKLLSQAAHLVIMLRRWYALHNQRGYAHLLWIELPYKLLHNQVADRPRAYGIDDGGMRFEDTSIEHRRHLFDDRINKE